MGETKAKEKPSSRGRKPKFSAKLFDAVITRISKNESTAKAIRAEGISPACFYDHVAANPEFLDVLQKAQISRDAKFKQQKIESLEQTAIGRAVDGWDEPVFHEGKVCGHKRKFSDVLLMFMLKGMKPDVYKDGTNINVNSTASANAVVVSSETKKQLEQDARRLREIIAGRAGVPA